MISNPEFKQIENDNGNNNRIEDVDLSKATNKELGEVANDILSNTENINQAKFFPDKRNSLNPEIKLKISSELTSEIQDCVNKLRDLWYNPEVTEKEKTQLATLEYVIENKDKIPQSWLKLEQKVNEIAKSIGTEINEKWIFDNTKADAAKPGNMFTGNNTYEYDNAA